MEWRGFRLIRMVVTMVMGAIIGWSAAVGNVIVLIVAVIVGILLLILIRYQYTRRVSQIIEDERTFRISEKASRITLRIFAFISAITGALFLAVSRSGWADLRQAGLTLAFSACALLVVYLSFYGYYGKRLGN